MTEAHSTALTAAVVREALLEIAEPEKAAEMQTYMKSERAFAGVSATARRRLVRSLVKRFPLQDAEEWRATVLRLWRDALYREELYVAIDLCDSKPYDRAPFQNWRAMPMYEEMIVTGAWWDLVDPIATHRLRYLLSALPRAMTRRMTVWSRSGDLWKRRASLICQVGRKKETDLALLYESIEANLDRSEFFLGKAIGWALRDYAWTDPQEVTRFVAQNRGRLSPLSQREALKNL